MRRGFTPLFILKVRLIDILNKVSIYEQIGLEVGKLVNQKNISYGNSFARCGEFLKLLYPNGVNPDQYTDMLTIVRMFDKLMRIATDKDALGEDPFRDLAGYSLLAIANKENINLGDI